MTETTLQERLRRQAEAQNKYNVWLGSIIEEAADALDAKVAEIARLREALKEIRGGGG